LARLLEPGCTFDNFTVTFSANSQQMPRLRSGFAQECVKNRSSSDIGRRQRRSPQVILSGELLLGGAVGDGPFTGLLIFTGENALEAARAFAVADPNVTGGVVTSWTARPWTTVVGNDAATPVRP
jgi:uncharacterized protein YciI